jgi:bidirectional [NiFe] hydrogenase diaphorase subunit
MISPAKHIAAQSLTLRINEKDVSCTSGQTILEVAREHGIDIPTLCFLDGLTMWGGCRLCLVEIAGSSKLHAACATPCTEGMDITTHSPRLHAYRKMIVELLFSERNHVCSVCVSNDNCELQALAQSLGITHVGLPYRYPAQSVDSSHDRFRLDHNRCILCTRCVRVCQEIEGARTKDVKGRGIMSLITHDLDQPWEEAESCTSCGKCVHVCPTGALTDKGTAVAEMAKRRQFLPYLAQMRETIP